MRQTLRVILLTSCFFLTAFAQDRYLVRAPGAAIQQIANRYGVTVVKSLNGSAQGLHVVSVPRNGNAAQILKNLKSDPAVQTVEHDDPFTVPEAVSAGPQLRGHSG